MEHIEKSKKPPFKSCIVPKCRNTIRNAPDKLYLSVPRGAEIRRKWCEIMNREMISPSSPLYCCEDHFDLEEDTDNFMEYKIMLGKEKTPLRLKKGVLPHKFQYQIDTEMQQRQERKIFLKRKHSKTMEGSLSQPHTQSVSVSNLPLKDYLEAGPSSSLLHKEHTEVNKPEPPTKSARVSGRVVKDYLEAGTSSSSFYSEHKEDKNVCEAGCSSSLSKVSCSSNKKTLDKAIQVNTKIFYRSKGINVNLHAKTKSTAVSPFHSVYKTTSTSPLKVGRALGMKKRKLFEDKADVASTSSAQPSLLSSSFEPESSSESSWVIDDDSEEERNYKNQMRTCMLISIEKEPKMLIGLPKRSYYLINLLSEHIPLPTIDILITLKKIKLNESFSILALQFGYTQSTVSRIFSKSIPLLAEKMKDLIVWPTPVEIFNNLPIAFRSRYSNVVAIIDYLEIQIEKPSNAVHQSLTWSQYKKCNTLKYLISCTPDGLVNFISEGYGGRATDVMIVEDCGFLERLPTKTAIMADRGFKDLSHLIEKKNCTLIRPPSVYKGTPSSKEDIRQSKRIAALRIHVERVINRLREFAMLLPHACVDHNLIPIIDDVIVIACGLINMQDVLIKK